MAESEIEGTDKLLGKLKGIPDKVLRKAKEIINLNSTALQRYMRTQKLAGGTTSERLKVRSGRLRASVFPIKAEIIEDRVDGGISIGTVYARVHIGPKGQETLITPKKGKFLAIPLPAAMTRAGVARGSPRRGPWGETFVRETDGKLIVFGKMQISKGKRTGELRSQVIPLFLLLKSVKIKARIHPEDLLSWIEPKIREDFAKRAIKVT